MSKALQAKLLRALESGEVRRIGENDSRRVDVRFVAATNIDLKAATATGEFRSDLYYRLNVHHVHLPPLRERRGDVPLLVAHFLGALRPGAPASPACAPAAMAVAVGLRLSRQRPPARAHHPARRRDRAIRPSSRSDDLPEELLAGAAASAPAPDGTVAAARERAEREMIVATLARHHGEVGAAARELQVSRTTMWRLMKKHGIEG